MFKIVLGALLLVIAGIFALFSFVSLITFDGNPFHNAEDALMFWSLVYGFYIGVGVYCFVLAGNRLSEANLAWKKRGDIPGSNPPKSG